MPTKRLVCIQLVSKDRSHYLHAFRCFPFESIAVAHVGATLLHRGLGLLHKRGAIIIEWTPSCAAQMMTQFVARQHESLGEQS